MRKYDSFAVLPVEAGCYDTHRYETFKEAEEAVKQRTARYVEPYGIFALVSKSKLPKSVVDIEMIKVETK